MSISDIDRMKQAANAAHIAQLRQLEGYAVAMLPIAARYCSRHQHRQIRRFVISLRRKLAVANHIQTNLEREIWRARTAAARLIAN